MMATKLIVKATILVGLIGSTDFIQQQEKYDIYWDGGRFSCDKCPPGTYWSGDCTPLNPLSVCHDCPDGHFQNISNKAESCAKCRTSCSLRQVVVENCSPTSNLRCECAVGFHWDPPAGLCLRHNACEPGYGVVSVGTPHQNTQCQMCEAGKNFSPNASLTQICDPCSMCPQELIQTGKCTTTNDTICGKISPDGEGMSTGIIIAIVLGSLGGVLALIILLICLYRRGSLNPILEKYGFPPRSDSCLEAVDTEQSERLQNGTTGHPPSNVTPTSSPITHEPLKVNLPHYNGVSKVDNNSGTLQQDSPGVSSSNDVGRQTDTKPRTFPQGSMEQNILSESIATTDNNVSYTSMPSSELSDGLLLGLSQDLISLNWEFFFRHLIDSHHKPDSLIDQVTLDYTKVHERIYQLLLKWRNLERENATLDSIIQALNDYGRPDLVTKYKHLKKCTTV